MIPLAQFIPSVCAAIPRFQQHPPDTRQQTCILHPRTDPLMIVAGPGSGKTTVLVLRALRLVFVDDLLPERIVLTTFTNKAADELRARLIEWGTALRDHLRQHPPQGSAANLAALLATIDINRFVTGTLDSICEEVLTRYREPADAAPVLVEGFVGNALLARYGLFPNGRHQSTDLAGYLAPFTFEGNAPRNFGETLGVSRTIVDRLIHDLVNVQAFRNGVPDQAGRQCLADALDSYRQYMDAGHRMDFARLEELFLERLGQGRLQRFTDSLDALFVDEYQDTNPLQERIYFELVRQRNASFTVVGDDDQSLYRFRGATVELFGDFINRFHHHVPALPAPHMVYLVDNYRSTPPIVGFFNAFLSGNAPFAPARVQPPKPLIVAQLPAIGVPVLGMFRPTVDALADDLTSFLWDVFRGPGRAIPVNGVPVTITRNPNGGDFGDAVVLSHTVNEVAKAFGNQPARERLPLLMRRRLSQLPSPVQVFNPRGRAVRDIPEVQQLLGLLLECIDAPDTAHPYGVQQAASMIRSEARRYLDAWRNAARAFRATNPTPNHPHRLAAFVSAWQSRTSQTAGMAAWPTEWPLLELCFKLVTWMPWLHDDPEGQVYLEAVSRCIAQAATFSPYRSMILHGQGAHDTRSVLRAINDIFVPLAESDVEVDEEIMPSVPRNRLNFMTIHQAKGLEFPLVIVDVASDYRTNHPKNRFRRFPEQPSAVQRMEDDLAPYCGIGALRVARPALERTFDDLVRLYYVAYSRAQSVLMLVGIDPCLQYSTSIRHVGLGWRSDGTWAWRTPVMGQPPALVNNIPLTLI
ncbi:MAG: UvrD-helicase domain-containing protein [Bacillota bacterium]